MDLTKEAILQITEMAAPVSVELHGLPFATRTLNVVAPPLAPAVTVGTLDGFVNLLESGIDAFAVEDCLIHIAGFDGVSLVARKGDDYGRRRVYAEADITSGVTSFQYFNRFSSQEEFVIGVSAHFQQNADREYLLDLASHITAKESVKQVDSGITQEVTVQRGAAFKDSVEAKNRLSLKPYRTFRELDQPASDFIFRVKEGAQLALFEADGGAWKIAAIGLISEWLKNRIQTSNVSELANLPIIS